MLLCARVKDLPLPPFRNTREVCSCVRKRRIRLGHGLANKKQRGYNVIMGVPVAAIGWMSDEASMRGEDWAIQVASQQVISGGPVHRRATHAICGRSAGRKSRRGTCVHSCGQPYCPFLPWSMTRGWKKSKRCSTSGSRTGNGLLSA